MQGPASGRAATAGPESGVSDVAISDGKTAATGLSVLPSGSLLAFLLLVSPAQAVEVDLELVLATDVSRSIDEQEALLQRQGVAAAFRSREVIGAIEAGSLGRIGVAYMDWSIAPFNEVIVDWMIIEDEESAEAFASALLAASPSYGQRTSISGAIQQAAQMLETNDLEGTYRTIDISGDGPNNAGLPLNEIRDQVIAKGITINGLPILSEDAGFQERGYFPDIDKYFVACVIGGRAAFALPARGFQDFAAAMRRKLVLEISAAPPPTRFARDDREEHLLVRIADTRVAQFVSPVQEGPAAGPAPLTGPPAQREENCDRFGYGGYGGFGGFGR